MKGKRKDAHPLARAVALKVEPDPLWGLTLFLPLKAALGIGSGITTTKGPILDGGVTLQGPQPRVPAASSTVRQSHCPCSRCHPPGQAESGSPLPAPSEAADPHALARPHTFQRRLMTYFLSSTWDLSRRLERLAFSARLLSQGCCRHWSALIRALGEKGARVNPAQAPHPQPLPPPATPEPKNPAGKSQMEGCAQGLVGLDRTLRGPDHPAWDRCPCRGAGLCWGQSEWSRTSWG